MTKYLFKKVATFLIVAVSVLAPAPPSFAASPLAPQSTGPSSMTATPHSPSGANKSGAMTPQSSTGGAISCGLGMDNPLLATNPGNYTGIAAASDIEGSYSSTSSAQTWDYQFSVVSGGVTVADYGNAAITNGWGVSNYYNVAYGFHIRPLSQKSIRTRTMMNQVMMLCRQMELTTAYSGNKSVTMGPPLLIPMER